MNESCSTLAFWMNTFFFQYQTMECDKGEEFPGQGIQSDEECPVWVVMESSKWPDEGRVCNQRSGGSMREWSYFAIFKVGENIQ